MPIDIKTESLWYRNPDGTYTEFRAVAPVIDDELSGNSKAPVQNKVITNALNKLSQDKQNKLTFDSTPTEESDNPVTSQGIKAALDTKLDIPEEPGTSDQVLGLDENLIPRWIDKDNSEDYAPVLINSASGEIASFNDGAANRKIRKLDVHLEPIQDLHGYDSPWPAGGGVNKLKITAESATINGVTFLVNKDNAGNVISVKVNGTATARSVFVLWLDYSPLSAFGLDGTYILSGCPSGGSLSTYALALQAQGSGNVADVGYGARIDTSSIVQQNYRFIIDVNAGTSMNNATFYPMLRLSSVVDATFAPYSNLCPISGRESVEVEAAGKNLWDKSNAQIGYIDNANGEVVPNTSYRNTGRIKVTPNTQYYILTEQTNGTWAAWYDKYGSFISGFTSYGTTPLVTSPANAGFVALTVSSSSSGNVDTFAVNYPSTDHDYHPYAGNRYTIQLGETVYGGDVGVVSGDGESKMAMVDLGTLTWRYQEASSVFYMPVPGKKPDKPIFCSVYKPSVAFGFQVQDYEIATGAANNYVYVKDPRYTDVASFKAAVAGQTLVYMLDTPTSLSTTPTEISTVEGENNVFSPDGDITVDYAADLKTYIDSKIAAAVAALS